MKGRITKRGILEIKRKGGKWRFAYCIMSLNMRRKYPCGDWCQFFHSPIKTGDGVYMQLCNPVPIYFDKFVDKREAANG